MGIIDNIRAFLNPPRQVAIRFEDRAADPDIDIYSRPRTFASTFGITDRDAPTDEEQRTANRGLVYRLAHMRADAIATAMLEVQVQRKVGIDEFEDVEEGNPWSTLLRNLTPNTDNMTFWRATSKLRDFGRGAFHYVARDKRGTPVSFYTIHPDFGEVLPQGNVMGGLDGFRYYPDGESAWIDIPPEDMIWVYYPHPVSPYESASLIEAAAYESDTDLYLKVYSRDSVREGNNPPFYVTFKEPLAQAQIDQYQKAFQQKYRTVGQPGNIPLLAGGGEIKSIGLNPDDLQYIDTARLNDIALMRIFGFPPAMFQESGVVANSEVVWRQWYKTSIQPEVNGICANLTWQFRRIFGVEEDPKQGISKDDLRIVPPNVVPTDEKEEAVINEIRIRSGQMRPAEVVEARGEVAPPELDQYFLSGGLRPVADMVRQDEPEAEEELVL